MRIFGAGMAGLVAANILRRYQPVVIEAQPELPDNHGALLRFRSDVVARAVGQRFLPVSVSKAALWEGRVVSSVPFPAANMYSRRVTGEAMERSILNLDPADRWIAPDTFCADLARGVDLRLGERVESLDGHDWPTISTIPMPALMRMVGWEDPPGFKYKPIWSVRARITYPPTRVYQTLYVPDRREAEWYRASITGDLLILEYAHEVGQGPTINEGVAQALEAFGLGHDATTSPPVVVLQKYGKLLPIPERERRAFILAMTDRYGVYSLGRFATWRQILLDDIVKDVRIIDGLITERDDYARHLL